MMTNRPPCSALRLCVLLMLIWSGVIAWGPSAYAQVPSLMPFQGLLLDDTGAPITNAVDLDFELFDDLTAGNSLWSESQQGVMVVDGVYSVTLGANTPISPGQLGGGLAFLAITVDGELLTPRQQLLSVPYALKAVEAENLGSVSSVFIEQMIESFPFDGSPPGNTDPSEGTGDTDADGIPNFVDPDNDNDGIPDGTEVTAGTSINLVTPTISNVATTGPVISYLPNVLAVTGTNFDTVVSVGFGAEAPTPAQLTPTSFEITVTPDELSPALAVQVTLANGETTTSAPLPIVNVAPVIDAISPPFVETGVAGNLVITGSGFVPGVTVQFGSQMLTPSALSATSLTIAHAAEPASEASLVVFHPNGLDSGPRVFQVVDLNGARLAFVSAGIFNGDLGGLAGADAICQAEAGAASLPGTYRAWLSDSVASPSTRFTQQGAFLRTDGVLLAYNWADLVDNEIAAPLNLEADGALAIATPFAWSGTNFDGTAVQGAINSCQNWTDSSSSAAPRGTIGNTSNWSGGIPSLFGSCSGLNGRLYCFQQ